MQTNEEHRVTYSAVIENEYHKSLYLMEHNSVALRLLRTLADNCKKFPFFTRTTTNSIKIKIRCCWSAFSMYLKMSPKCCLSTRKKFFVITKPAGNPSLIRMHLCSLIYLFWFIRLFSVSSGKVK